MRVTGCISQPVRRGAPRCCSQVLTGLSYGWSSVSQPVSRTRRGPASHGARPPRLGRNATSNDSYDQPFDCSRHGGVISATT